MARPLRDLEIEKCASLALSAAKRAGVLDRRPGADDREPDAREILQSFGAIEILD